MRIENDLTLVMIGQAESNPTYIECYPIEHILSLQALPPDVELSGHPGKDLGLLESDEPLAFAVESTRQQAKQVQVWTAKGLYIAVGYLKSKRGRQAKLSFSWRRPESYLSPEEIAWLEAYHYTSYDFTDHMAAWAEIASGIQKLAAQDSQDGKPRKKKSRRKDRPPRKRLKAKERKRLAIEESGGMAYDY